jgi:hypothetical protein
MPKRRRLQLGAQLIETQFAIFLAFTCATIYVATIPTANRSRDMADKSNVAVALAQKQLEAIKGVDPTLSPDVLFSAGLIDSRTPVGPNKWSFTNVDTAAFDNPARVLKNGQGFITVEQVDLELRRVTVEIQWTEQGRSRSIRVGTLVADMNN